MSAPWPLQTLGDPSRPPVVFLHGFLGQGDDWLPVARRLSQDFYCLLPDLPGHGANPPDPAPGYAVWAAGLRRTLEVQGIRRACLVGYSLGGRLALYFALEHPEAVVALALESASPGISAPQERTRRAAWDDENASRLLRDGIEGFLAYWYALPLFASLARFPTLRADLYHKRARQDAAAMAAVVRALSPGRQPDLWPRLPALRPPLLAYSGAWDEKYSAIVRRIGQTLPTAQTAILPDAGHNVHCEQPVAVACLLREWLLRAK